MKTIRSRAMIVIFSAASLLFITFLILAWNSWGLFRNLEAVFFACLLPYLGISSKIKFNDEHLYLIAGWKKVKIDYKDIVAIYSAANPFGYWLKTFDTRERKFMMMFPLEHKRMRELFDAIEKANPDAQINIMWYKKEKHEKYVDFKTLIKWACFIVAICLVDYVYQKFIK